MTYIAHGTDPNQIGHGADIDTGDTPGSTGGKFIGFGEDGTSANANRAHWFLSQNIDHVYQEVHRDIAVPKRYDRTSPVGGESSFQFPNTDSEEIWTGDDTYPGSAGSSDLEGMQILYNILDSNYNELTDGEDNEIRVKLVRDSTDVTDVYQGGFKDQPVIHFIAVDPNTGATVTDPYTIPAATNYKIICGIKSTVAEMPADALIRFKAQSSSELEAGVLLQDGTRPLTGTLDLNDQGITDQYFSGALALSESGQTALYQPVDAAVYPSLVGAVNSNIKAQEFMQGDRCMDRTGTFTTGSAPSLTYPAIKVSLGGQILEFASDTVTASGNGDGQHFLYVTAAGVLSFGKFANWAAVLASAPGAIPVWTAELTTSETVWEGAWDLRWAGTSGKHNVIYVGTGVGADFASLNDAANWLAVTTYGAEDTNVSYEIVVVGETEVQSSVTLPDGWTLRGLSRRGHNDYAASAITTDTDNFLATSNVIITGDNCTVKDLTINWGRGVDQTSGYYGLQTGAHCLVESVKFTKSTHKFANNLNVGGASADDLGPVVRECYFNNFSERAIRAHGTARLRIDNCTFITDSAATYHIEALPVADTGDDRVPGVTVVGCYFKGGCSSANILLGGPNVLIDSCQAELTGSTTPFVLISGDESQNAAGATIRNCLLENGYTFLSSSIADVAVRLSVFVENCVCTGFTSTLCSLSSNVSAESSVVIDRNLFVGDGSTSLMGLDIAISNVRLTNNKFVDWTQYAVSIDSASNALENFWISDNHFYSCATRTVTVDNKTAPQGAAIFVDETSNTVKNVYISRNLFQAIDSHAIEFVSGGESVTITDNVFDTVKGVYLYDSGGGNANLTKGGVVRLDDARLVNVSGNRFTGCGFKHTITGETIWGGALHIYASSSTVFTVSNNDFGQCIPGSGNGSIADSWFNIDINGSADVMCSNNHFYQDLAGGLDAPGSEFMHVRMNSSGILFVTGCFMTLTGDTTGGNDDGGYACLEALTDTQVYATNCYTLGDWVTTSTTEKIWDLEGAAGTPAYGCVVGCVFAGNRDVDINQVNGFSIGNVHRRAASSPTGTMTLGDHPVVDTYSSLSASNPRAVFNKTFDTL